MPLLDYKLRCWTYLFTSSSQETYILISIKIASLLYYRRVRTRSSMRVICERGFFSEFLDSKLVTDYCGLESIMAVTNTDKIAKLEAKVASLRLQYNFLSDHLKMISGKNPNLESKVKSVMEWNQSLQLKVLGEVDSLRTQELAAQDNSRDGQLESDQKENKT